MRFACAHLTAVLCASMSLAQVRTTPTQVPNVTAPGPQQPAQAQPQRQQPLPGTRAPQPILQTPGAGTVEGFVYWDTASVSHTPASTCSGLAVIVAVGNSSGGKSNAYQPLGTLTNNFKFVGQVKQFLAGGKIKTYDVCTYGYGHVPVGPDLRVTVLAEGASPSQAGPFSPASVPQVDPIGPVTIVNGQCNMLPRIVNPIASDLFAHWGSCQNMAYDVNFMMQPAQKVLSSGGSGVSSARGAQGGMLSGSTQQQGMLTSGAGPSTQSQSTEGSLLGNRGQASPSLNGGTRQTYTGTTRPSGALTGPGGRVLTNADVIKLVGAGIPEDTIMKSTQSARKQFDFSAVGCRALQQANVSAIIVVAMGDGSVRPCPAITGNVEGSRSFNGPGIQDPDRRAITDITNRGTASPATPGSKVELNPQPFPPKMASPPATGASKVELNPQPFPPRTGNNLESQASPDLQPSSRQALTNADLIRMLNQGLPESVIVHTIQSSTKQFDFSREGMQALQQAHVSPGVLAAMCDGSARGCTGMSGSAPSATPSNKATRSARTALKPIKLEPPKPLRKITNPRLAELNAGIIAVLQQQRQAAEQEASAMKVGTQAIASAASARTPALSANFRGNAPSQDLVPQTTQDASGSFSSSIVHAPAFNSIVLTCSTDPTPRILRVGGGQAPTIFTPEAKYNLYTIVGCSFGQSQAGNSAYIFAGNGFKANLNIDFWSENGITAHLDPYLAGVLDQSNLSLVVSPAGKQQIEKQGFKFYAARGMPNPDRSDQEVLLPSMPQPNVVLGIANSPLVAAWGQVPPSAKSKFPSFSFTGTPVAGWVFRYAYGHHDGPKPCFINDVKFPPEVCHWYFGTNPHQTDAWDFKKLVPGFAISSYSLYYEDIDASTLCGAWDDEASGDRDGIAGKWDFNLNSQNQIVVSWPVYYCHDMEESGRENKQVQSSYGLAVWALGPRCVDPWTGQKDQVCMNKVKQIL